MGVVLRNAHGPMTDRRQKTFIVNHGSYTNHLHFLSGVLSTSIINSTIILTIVLSNGELVIARVIDNTTIGN